MHSYVIAALSTIAIMWKQAKYPPIGNWIKKTWFIYTMEYYSAIEGMKSYYLLQHGARGYYAK